MARRDATTRLLELKERIEAAKTRKAQAEGRRDQLLQTLKKDFKVSSVKEAEALLKKMDKDLADAEKELEKGLASLSAELG